MKNNIPAKQNNAGIPKRTVKDSLFTKLFRSKSYVLKLYKDLHPEDKDVTEKDIIICTLETVLTDGLYNDLGFIVGDRLIILIEAQTVWDRNITMRSLMYIVQSYINYINDSGQDIHQKKKLKLPRPELYIVYSGNREIPEEELSLSKSFFGGSDVLDLRITLLNKEDGSLYGQYIAFCRTLDEQRKLYKDDPKKAIQEAIRICIERDVLMDYLEQHRMEVVDMTLNLFDQDTVFEHFLVHREKEWFEEGVEKGIARGREEGIAKGREEGIAKGREDSTKELIMRMRSQGYTEEQISRLFP